MTNFTVSAGPNGFEAQIHTWLDRPQAEALIPSIEIRTLAEVGFEDGWRPPECHKSIADALPNSEHVEIDGSDQVQPIETAAEFTETVRKRIGTGE